MKPPPCLRWLPALLLPLLAACTPIFDDSPPTFGNRDAYRPVYATREILEKIEVLGPQPLRNPGKIYVRGSYLFINELSQGIHVLDNADPHNPRKLSFLRILGNVDIAAKGNYLYADNLTDLLAFDISDPTAAKLVKRVADVFPQHNYPPFTNVVFECVDPAKGLVVGWEKVNPAQAGGFECSR